MEVLVKGCLRKFSMVMENTSTHALFLIRYFTLVHTGRASALCFFLISSWLSPSRPEVSSFTVSGQFRYRI